MTKTTWLAYGATAIALVGSSVGVWSRAGAGSALGGVTVPDASAGSRVRLAAGGVFAPSILFDDARGVFRLWYHGPGTTSRIDVLYRQSLDGRTWGPPRTVHAGDEWGTGVRRDGASYRWLMFHILQTPGMAPGMYSAESPNGTAWGGFRGPLLRMSDGVGDIIDLFRDPLRGRWGAFVKMYARSREFGPDPRMASVRRLTGVTSSDDFERWAAPRRVFVPDQRDEGEMEFYGAACCLVRGQRLIAFLRILRDDIGDGIGYTVLAWSDDGITWQRTTTPFLDRCPNSFDASTAWVYGVAEHAGTVYLAYSAYASGHKVGDRAVGLATMPSGALSVPDGRGPGCEP